MKKVLVGASILVLSLIPVFGFSSGQTKLQTGNAAQVAQVENVSSPQSQVNAVSPEQTTNVIPVVMPFQPPIQQDQEVAPETVRTEAVTNKTAPTQTAPQKVKKSVSTTPAGSVSASAQQSEMLGYINTARAQAGLAPLVLDGSLNNAAYLKSQDMAVNGYFSHYSPTYGSPFEMMTSLGISYGTAGENIAKNFSVKGAEDAFMNSPGHKANILNPDFKKVGLGFYKDSTYLYVTQMFTD